MSNAANLTKLLRSESILKQTKAGYTPTGPNWRRGMPLLWEVRTNLGSSAEGIALAEAHGTLKKTEKGYDPHAPRWKHAMFIIDSVEEYLSQPIVPALGPVIPGGKSILLEAPTHETDGVFDSPNVPKRNGGNGSHYPAFDYGWDAGVKILAPEDLIITGQSSAMGADAFYALGDSQLAYWFGHLTRSPATNTRFHKGQVMSTIAAIPGADHGHLGIDARKLTGKDLKWGKRGNGPDYTYGSPTIGRQLAMLLEA